MNMYLLEYSYTLTMITMEVKRSPKSFKDGELIDKRLECVYMCVCVSKVSVHTALRQIVTKHKKELESHPGTGFRGIESE